MSERTSEPRRWELPPEPGPEVTAIRVEAGRRYIRTRMDTDWPGWRGEGLHRIIDWAELLKYGPLTDASAESTDA